jgi:hypothetical protein
VRSANRRYHEMSARHFVDVGRRYGASHVVREAQADPILLSVLYRDDEYVLYELPR